MAAGAALVAGPAFAAGPCAAPGRARLDAAFARDMRAKDFAVLRLYAPGAVFVQPDGSKVRGPAELRKLYRTVFATYDSDLALDPKVVTAVAERRLLCVEEGVYTETLRTRATGEVMHVTGRFRFTSEQGAGGRWRYVRMEWLNG